MKCGKWVACMLSLVVAQTGVLIAQEPNVSAGKSQELGSKPPEHPVTEEQLRAYFDVCRVSAVSRQLTHEKMESQRQQLPSWYPQSVCHRQDRHAHARPSDLPEVHERSRREDDH